MKLHSRLALAAAAALCVTATHATVWQFNAHLAGAHEVPPNGSPADGLATLFYDDRGTADWADDTFDFSMAVFNLTGSVTGFHIHGAANEHENGPVRVDLQRPPFQHSVMGSTLLVGGDDAPAPWVSATPASAVNQGYPAMSFLDMLRNGLGYVNVHTVAYPAGEARGQFRLVAEVPEPSTYALMLAGLAAVGFLARRRR